MTSDSNNELYDFLQTSIVELIKCKKTNVQQIEMILNSYKGLDCYKHSKTKRTLLGELCNIPNFNFLFEIIDFMIMSCSSEIYYNLDEINNTLFHLIGHFPTRFFEYILTKIESKFNFGSLNSNGKSIFHIFALDWRYEDCNANINANLFKLINCSFVTKDHLNILSHDNNSLFLHDLIYTTMKRNYHCSLNKYFETEIINLIKQTQIKGINIMIKNISNNTILDMSNIAKLNLISEYLESEFNKENEKLNPKCNTNIHLNDFVRIKGTKECGFVNMIKFDGIDFIADVVIHGTKISVFFNNLEILDYPLQKQLRSGDHI